MNLPKKIYLSPNLSLVGHSGDLSDTDYDEDTSS